MTFGEIPLSEAVGAILAHAYRAKGINFSKGRRLTADDVAKLQAAGVSRLVAAKLGNDDVHEDEAARLVAEAVSGENLSATSPFTGRVNLFAEAAGVVAFDVGRLDALNLIDESITVATLPAYSAVEPKQMVATIKVIPFAAPREALDRVLALAREGGKLVGVSGFRALRAGLVQTTLPGTRDKVLDKALETTRARMTALGGMVGGERRCAHEAAAIGKALAELRAEGCDLFLVAGASAIVDRRDEVPAGIEDAGGTVVHFGMPVDPGNLLLLGRWQDDYVLGLPGCAKSPKFNGFDMVLQRIAAGLPVGRHEVMRMGAGGLLAEIASRGLPRTATPADEDAPAEAPRAPRIAALVLAAGRSSRMMGRNKLLAPIDGRPMVVHAVDAALRSQAQTVTVVLGHMAEDVRAAVASLGPRAGAVRYVHNPDFAEGLSTSLRVGVAALPADSDGALMLLGDMPAVTGPQIDRLIAAFNPVEGRAICVPTVGGKRGNPVLWARRFFSEIGAVQGDVGARHLIGEHTDQVCEVEMGDSGVLVDLDTPEALDAFVAGRTS
jgi:molybdenum cofactor cytidylyltransferase